MAEERRDTVDGKVNLVGATKFWKMVILLRPIFFQVHISIYNFDYTFTSYNQCAAAIYQKSPNSAIFRLPALSHPEVQAWMKTDYATSYAQLCAAPANMVDLARVQTETLRTALEEMRSTSSRQSRFIEEQARQIAALTAQFNRRTAQWSLPKAFTADAYGNPASISRQLMFEQPLAPFHISIGSSPLIHSLAPPAKIDASTRALEDTGVYMASDKSPRGYALPSPTSTSTPRPRTQLDLVLPPPVAFCNPGEDLVAPAFLGRQSAEWPLIFESVKQPGTLWEAWRPSQGLNNMSVEDIWNCYTYGEKVFDATGTQTGVKPLLRLVEQHFGTSWRKESSVCIPYLAELSSHKYIYSNGRRGSVSVKFLNGLNAVGSPPQRLWQASVRSASFQEKSGLLVRMR